MTTGGPNASPGRNRRRRGLAVAAGVAAALSLGPAPVVVARAVVNLPASASAVVWARAHGGNCTVRDDLTVACAEMRGGYARAGTTIGNVWLYGALGGSDRHRHEARHSDQWAMLSGGPTFPLLYGAECLRTGGTPEQNVFERWAGLRDGGYRN